MQWHRWLAVAVIAAWTGQLVNLWPLPWEVGGQLPASADAASVRAIAQLESFVWRMWLIRLVAIPVGVASGFLLLRNHRQWPVVVIIAALSALLFSRPWYWLPLFTPLFSPEERGLLLSHPRLIFNIAVFPCIVLVATFVAGLELVRRKRRGHSI
jgi:hypothetical protein